MKHARLRWIVAGATLMLGICCARGYPLQAQTSWTFAHPSVTSDDSSTSKSWTSSTERQFYSTSLHPVRTKESHTESGNRTVDTQVLERQTIEGDYELYLVVEKETVKVDSTTVRTVQRSYARGPNGQRQLVQVTEEEESRNLSSGEVRTVRTTSNPYATGSLQVVHREVEQKKQTSPNVQEIRRSVFTPDVNGGLSESLRSEERQTRSGTTLEFQKTDRVRDGSGAWQTLEVRQGTVKEDGKQRSREENVLQPDSYGKLAVVQRTIGKETADRTGQPQSTSETYQLDVPGRSRDGSLHPVERVTTVHRVGANGRQSTQTEVEQPNPGSPTAGLELTSQQVTISTRDADRVTHETRTFRATGGNPGVAWVDMGVSNRPNEVHVSMAPVSGSTATQATSTGNSPDQSQASPQAK
jgi:hypothetical protein